MEPRETSRVLAETLVETLSLDACCVAAALSPQDSPLLSLYVNGRAADVTREPDWQTFAATATRDSNNLDVTEEDTPSGKMRVARFPLGYYGCQGQITAASSRTDFPRPTELLLLRSAASLAASGLRTARLTYERERAMRAKDEFLAMLGHELRNPLAPIVTALELLKIKTQGNLSPEHVIIERQVSHLKGLVDDLLDVTRITSGKIKLDLELVELHSIVMAALEAANPLIEQRRHQVISDIPEQGLPVNVDPLRLAQVVTNLLINAAKYTEPEGKISIIAGRNAESVELKVIDNGVGIDAKLLPHVFDLFEQGAVSIDRSRGGLGIGLSVAKSLIALHNGSISAASEGLGKGSTFTINLPLSAVGTPAILDKAWAAITPAEKLERILVVDDNQDAADSLAKLLEAYGHEVHVYYTPMEAMAACTALHPTLVIVDIGLPSISGYELASLIRTRLVANPPRILAVTGYGQASDRARSQSAGIEAHFTKPISIEVLLDHIHNKSESEAGQSGESFRQG